MTETKKKLHQIKIDKKAQALRDNLKKRKWQQRARQEDIQTLEPIISSIIEENSVTVLDADLPPSEKVE